MRRWRKGTLPEILGVYPDLLVLGFVLRMFRIYGQSMRSSSPHGVVDRFPHLYERYFHRVSSHQLPVAHVYEISLSHWPYQTFLKTRDPKDSLQVALL